MPERLSAPRIPPLPEGERTEQQREVIDWLVVGPTVNIYTTLARHPDLARAQISLGRQLRSGELPVRDREILILRTGWNCTCEYEFAQHRRFALQAGMTLDEIRRIQDGPDADGWDPLGALLCRAADELHHGQMVSDATWANLEAHYDEKQLVELPTLVGYYHLVCISLNTFGVPLEDGAAGFVTD